MPRYKLTIAYDGTEFCGWQKQFPHVESVPAHLHGFKLGDPDEWAPDSPQEPDADPLAPATPHPDPTSDISSPPHPLTPSPSHPPPRPRRELRTVQAVLERAVRLVVREPVSVLGSSRTDAGVHARGQIAAFSTLESGNGRGWPAERGTLPLMRAVNARLPDDVLVRSIEVVPDDFDPILHTVAKGYTYTLWCADHRPLWQRRTVMHLWRRLDVAAMNAAAAELVGEHDFAAFAAAGHGRLTTVRRVLGCEVIECATDRRLGGGRCEPADGPEHQLHPHTVGDDENLETGMAEWPPAPSASAGEAAGDIQKLVIRVWGTGFLWNMVRIIAGTLVEAGRDRCSPQRVRDALRTGDRRLAGPTFPAQGLCLEWIRYEPGCASGDVDEE